MSRIKKAILIAIAAIAAVLCVLCCLYIYQYFRGSQVHQQLEQLARPVEQPEAPEQAAEVGTEAADGEPEDNTVPGMDFEPLNAVNEEIYAWIEIPGTSISCAVVQSAADDLFYNNHAVDKSYFSGGSVYTQRYNTKTFDDPMTLVYGHNFHDQSIFAPLLNFCDGEFFRENRCIYIYTPDALYEYEIFAAYPHTSEHLLLCYDFAAEESFNGYFEALTDKTNANYDREKFPVFGDKVLTLSTCYRLSFGQRFLVQATLVNTYPVRVEETAHE